MEPEVLDSLVRGVLDRLEEWFLLDYAVSGQPLGVRLEAIMREVGDGRLDRWGAPGSSTDLARDDDELLTFLYRPHLFPGMDAELQLGHEVQFHLLPRRVPGGVDLHAAAVLESYCHLSGDLIGWRAEPGGQLLAWMFDVSGHGIRAGFAAVVLKLLLEDSPPGLPLEDLAADLERRFLAARNPGDRGILFATGVFVRARPRDDWEYVSAGHPPVLVRRADGSVEEYEATGMPLALVEGDPPTTRIIQWSEGDVAVLYTDGVLEATDGEGRELGLNPVRDAVASAQPSPEMVARELYRLVAGHHDLTRLDDDLSVLALSRR